MGNPILATVLAQGGELGEFDHPEYPDVTEFTEPRRTEFLPDFRG